MINPEKYTIKTDFTIIGSGVAGLMAAHILKEHGNVLVLSNRSATDCSTRYAQGGVAVVLKEGDSYKKHIEDTKRAGVGLCDDSVVEYVIKEGPRVIKEIIGMGAYFDREGDSLYFTREGAHSEKRVIHSFGDATGKEIERTLILSSENHPNITMLEYSPAVRLITEEGCVKGVVFFSCRDKKFLYVPSRITILATGGIGGLYIESSNPESVTGSGFGLASRAGCILRDMEFIQFHPTVFFQEGEGQKFLITEAMRGEGAWLVDSRGKRFMQYYHKDKELAPRDVVSRAIYNEMKKKKLSNVYLDNRHLDADFVKNRFPTIYKKLLGLGINITKDLIPVRPAAHYIMGGVLTDIYGRTNLPGLLCCGECASTGIHGANRLASNSLLEGLVFGKRTALTAVNEARMMIKLRRRNIPLEISGDWDEAEIEGMIKKVKSILWLNAGIIREEKGLKDGYGMIKEIYERVADSLIASCCFCEFDNMLLTAMAVFRSALYRRESVGGHFRSDFPFRNPVMPLHTYIQGI